MLTSASLYFMLPVIGLVLAVTLAAIAIREPMARGAGSGAIGFLLVFFAGAIDVQRGALPFAVAALVVPLQWAALLFMMRGFLARHNRSIRWHFAGPGVGFALLIHGWFYFGQPDFTLRVLNSNLGSAIILSVTAWRHRDLTARMLDRVIYGLLASNAIFFGLLATSAARMISSGGQIDHWVGSQPMMVTYIGTTLMGLVAALAFVVAIGMDLVEHHHRSSRSDPLTGLGNRRALDAQVDAQANGAQLYGAALMIDLDHFKAVNDKHGHDGGDAVLRAVGQALQAK
ncbi:MAG: hypothetical protein RLZZ58_594, partial [Pseudomonadota bacterium]